MNYFRTIIIIIILAVTTGLILGMKPQINKRVIIEDANYNLAQEQPQAPQPQQQQQFPPQKTKNVQPKAETIIAQDSPNKITPRTHKNISLNSPKPRAVTKSASKPIQKQLPKVVEKKINPPVEPKRQLTEEEEEIIAWNNWRSDLQNKVMKDTKMYAPIGTVFRFSFTVDKFGTISNLKTWSDTSAFTPTAVRIIKPKLMSYQGQSILNFPPKSKRVVTNVTGGFTIWYKSGYSSPSDYSDYERVK